MHSDQASNPDDMSSAEFRASVFAALQAGDARMDRIEAQLAESTKQATDTHKNTAEIVELFQAMKGGIKVLGWLGQLAKWIAPFIGAYFALRQAGINGGWWPFR